MIQGMFKLSVMGSGFSQGFADVCACDTQKSDCGCGGGNDAGCGCGSSGNTAQKLMQILSNRVKDVTVRIAKDDFWNKEKYSASLRTLVTGVTVIMISPGGDWGDENGPNWTPDGGPVLQCIADCIYNYYATATFPVLGVCMDPLFLLLICYDECLLRSGGAIIKKEDEIFLS